jgi:hypothetical protein
VDDSQHRYAYDIEDELCVGAGDTDILQEIWEVVASDIVAWESVQQISCFCLEGTIVLPENCPNQLKAIFSTILYRRARVLYRTRKSK